MDGITTKQIMKTMYLRITESNYNDMKMEARRREENTNKIQEQYNMEK